MRRTQRLVVHSAMGLGAITAFMLGTAGAALAAKEFTVDTKTVQTADIDVDDDDEFSQGDQAIFADTIENDDGDKIGTVGGVCTATKVKGDEDFELECLVTYDLPRGQITTHALLDEDDFDEGEFTAAVTGGTGVYKNATGEAHVELTDDGSEVTFVIELNEEDKE